MKLVKTSQSNNGPAGRRALSRALNAAAAAAIVGGAGEMPSADAIAALRAWYEGLSARDAVRRYLGQLKADGQSSRAILSAIRLRLVKAAQARHRHDLEPALTGASDPNASTKRTVRLFNAALDSLSATPLPVPRTTDDVQHWIGRRTANALHGAGVVSMADLLVRVRRRRTWWRDVKGIGAIAAAQVERFLAGQPQLVAAVAALPSAASSALVPWERLQVPQQLDGSRGAFRAPLESCALEARNDYEAVTAWLERHEAAATQRAYRKEVERLMLWSIVERGKPMSSLTAEDATAYRAFMRRPTPHLRWVGPARPRESAEWRPFAGPLSSNSTAYTLTVLNSLFRWLIEQRYVLVNPFSGLKVRGADSQVLDPNRSFTDSEWTLIRTIADGLEWSYGWSKPAAQRLRFLLDFSYATGLRAAELVGARLGHIKQDSNGARWLHVRGKGAKPGKVALPPLATGSLDQYLATRGVPTTPHLQAPSVCIVGRLSVEEAGSLTTSRLWAVCKRFFATAAAAVGESNPGLADKLLAATPHWMRHTHATHSLQRGVDLPAVRDNLRHASIGTTSTYLHVDDERRSTQIAGAFGVGGSGPGRDR